jgi:pimeloyl-ACP methyl ester carboxylesterase
VQYAIEYPCLQGNAAFEKQVRAIESFDCQKSLPSIKQHTLIVCWKEDLLLPPEESIKVLQAIPSTSVSVIEDAAHSIHVEITRAFTDCVSYFMNNR